jgi:hypothetical protein
MRASGATTVAALGLVALGLPLLDIGETLAPAPRSLADLSGGIVQSGKAVFGDCRRSGGKRVRNAALAVASIEAFNRTKMKAAVEWSSAYLGIPALEERSLGPAQIKLPTARRFVRLTDAEIAKRLLSDNCWSLDLAASILSERMSRCRSPDAMACMVAAAASYNGQKRLSGPNVAYRVVFQHVYRELPH